jgi:predicted nucleic acid-binding protein
LPTASQRQSARAASARPPSAWLRTSLHLYGDRVLPFDATTAEIAGALSDLARGRGSAPGFADIVIAATARRHDLTILTRNGRHFAPMDAVVVDPFRGLP